MNVSLFFFFFFSFIHSLLRCLSSFLFLTQLPFCLLDNIYWILQIYNIQCLLYTYTARILGCVHALSVGQSDSIYLAHIHFLVACTGLDNPENWSVRWSVFWLAYRFGLSVTPAFSAIRGSFFVTAAAQISLSLFHNCPCAPARDLGSLVSNIVCAFNLFFDHLV